MTEAKVPSEVQVEVEDEDEYDFGAITAVVGLLVAAALIVVMFATSGQV